MTSAKAALTKIRAFRGRPQIVVSPALLRKSQRIGGLVSLPTVTGLSDVRPPDAASLMPFSGNVSSSHVPVAVDLDDAGHDDHYGMYLHIRQPVL
ncbi:hypothetical protein [Mesorhizobium sp. 43Arga]